jgi:hypothetical protein
VNIRGIEDRFVPYSLPQQQFGSRPNNESLAKQLSNYLDPAGLVLDGVTISAFSKEGQLMKMQSGQKLVFYDKRIIDILKSTGAAKQAITVGTVVKGVGTGLGFVGIGLTWVQVGNGEKHWIEGSMDSVVGVIGMAAPGPGTAVALLYFMATQSNSYPDIYRDPRIVPMDNTYVSPSYPIIK